MISGSIEAVRMTKDSVTNLLRSGDYLCYKINYVKNAPFVRSTVPYCVILFFLHSRVIALMFAAKSRAVILFSIIHQSIMSVDATCAGLDTQCGWQQISSKQPLNSGWKYNRSVQV
jgi:hypothetical protein